MKFTRSLPAKARARANVPARMVIFKMFTFICCKISNMTDEIIQIAPSDNTMWSFMRWLKSSLISPELFIPLKMAK